MAVERTLIIFKPDCIEQDRVGEVLGRFEEAGLEIRGCKMMALSEELLHEHYAHLIHLPVFSKITEFMSSMPVVIMVLKGEDAVGRVRELLGPTDSKEAPAGSIRGDLGSDKTRNIAHASDSVANAEKEIDRFFSTGEIY